MSTPQQAAPLREPRPGLRRQKALLALVLASIAGFVDAVGFIALHRLFVAHMSGNTVKLGIDLGKGRLGDALPLAVAVGLFVLGIATGSAIRELGFRRGWRSPASALIGLQGALIAGFMAYGSTVVHGASVPGHTAQGFYAMAAMAIVAMGLQTATLQHIGVQTIRTTYVSGILTSFAQAVVHWAVGDGGRRLSGRRAALLGGIWILYLAGGVLGAYTDGLWRLWSLGLPLGALAFVLAVDLWQPIEQHREEREGAADAARR